MKQDEFKNVINEIPKFKAKFKLLRMNKFIEDTIKDNIRTKNIKKENCVLYFNKYHGKYDGNIYSYFELIYKNRYIGGIYLAASQVKFVEYEDFTVKLDNKD